jgi:ubiquinone/menaquinone biosynthesis C-methylase UbiE
MLNLLIYKGKKNVSLSKRFFASWYDLLNWYVERRLSALRQETAGRTWGDVLEIGGGTGANLKYFPPDSRITIIEPDPHMRRKLRQKAIRQRRVIRIARASGERLPYADASFDCVLSTLVLCMVDDQDEVIREARRVLKPGGAFLFYEHVVSPRKWGRRMQNALNPLWSRATTGCNLNRDIAASIHSAGFSSVEMRAFDLSIGLPVTIPNIIGVARA